MKAPARPLKVLDIFHQQDKIRIETIRADIACRLQNSCSDLSPEEFALLVEKIASVQVGGEGKSR